MALGGKLEGNLDFNIIEGPTMGIFVGGGVALLGQHAYEPISKYFAGEEQAS